MSSQPPNKKRKFTDHKSKNYYRPNKKHFLEAGQRGFLATCNFREKECIRECYNILNEYADQLYGPQQVKPTEATEDNVDTPEVSDDIADELQREINAATTVGKGKDALKHRFQVVDTATANCVFIKTTLSDPVELGQRIVTDIASSKEKKTRFLLRLVPIETVCRANLDDILNAAGQLCDRYFLKQSSTFSIIFNKRYNNDLSRDSVIHALAELVQSKNIHNKVDLKQAEKCIVVEVIKGLCCLSVVEGYLKYKKYNLLELANVKMETPKIAAEENSIKSTEVSNVDDDDGDAKKVDENGTENEENVEQRAEENEENVEQRAEA